MRYYGIVNQLRQKPGLYGRRPPKSEQEVQTVMRSSAQATWAGTAFGAGLLYVLSNFPLFAAIAVVAGWFLRRRRPLRLILQLNGDSLCLLSDKLLDGDYSLSAEDKSALHNLISDTERFKAIMTSEGGSELYLLERSQVHEMGLKHHGGVGAQFSPGLYCEHPKDNTVLLPLETAGEILQSEILGEMVDVFEALGATRITIEDITEFSARASGGDGRVAAGASVGVTTKLLRESRYAPNKAVDVTRALNNKRHVRDLRNVMSIVEARTYGNQTYQRFEETVSVNCGLDVSVLGIFGANAKAKFKRQWSFEVEFQSKHD
jgi:hypothetical protein